MATVHYSNIRAVQHMVETCWRNRHDILAWESYNAHPRLFFRARGGIEVDVDRCISRCRLQTRSSTRLFNDILCISIDILEACKAAIETFFTDILDPLIRSICDPGERTPMWQLMLYGHRSKPALLNLGTLWPPLAFDNRYWSDLCTGVVRPYKYPRT
jgi:hypothetical protein